MSHLLASELLKILKPIDDEISRIALRDLIGRQATLKKFLEDSGRPWLLSELLVYDEYVQKSRWTSVLDIPVQPVLMIPTDKYFLSGREELV